uniref:Uncharacterized protein LOC105034259 isoform X2 n=1 Tax=Elaeis guineensis var. tenera TaxID=51953 RepID=A0A8N4EXU2_ELAGV|nr:uncharacterized protein LOC105034259 isoform X2 [Elaeis guineensis]
MPEVVVDIDAGRKRRLPAWMLRVSSPDKQRTSQSGDKTCSPLKDQPETQDAGSKSKGILTQDTDVSDKLDLSQRCEAKQGTRKARRRGLGLDKSKLSEAQTKHKKEADGGERMLDCRDTAKKQKLKSKRSKNSDMQVTSPGKEDEIELTVEDLYVNADKEKQHEHSITRESHLKANPSSLSASSNVNAGRPIQAAGSGKIISKCITTSSSSYLTDTERNKEKRLGGENFATNITRTGDTVQDMLDLFIGPLLQKPSAIEQENGTIKTESMNITVETDKQARSRELWREEGTLVLTKKKSSFKDKVAMFLD